MQKLILLFLGLAAAGLIEHDDDNSGDGAGDGSGDHGDDMPMLSQADEADEKKVNTNIQGLIESLEKDADQAHQATQDADRERQNILKDEKDKKKWMKEHERDHDHDHDHDHTDFSADTGIKYQSPKEKAEAEEAAKKLLHIDSSFAQTKDSPDKDPYHRQGMLDARANLKKEEELAHEQMEKFIAMGNAKYVAKPSSFAQESPAMANLKKVEKEAAEMADKFKKAGDESTQRVPSSLLQKSQGTGDAKLDAIADDLSSLSAKLQKGENTYENVLARDFAPGSHELPEQDIEPEFRKDLGMDMAKESLLQIDSAEGQMAVERAFLAEEARKNHAFREREAAKDRVAAHQRAHLKAKADALDRRSMKTFKSLQDGALKKEMDGAISEVNAHADDFAKDADSWKAKLAALQQQELPSSFVEEAYHHHDHNPFLTPTLMKLQDKVKHELAKSRRMGKRDEARIRREHEEFKNAFKKSDDFSSFAQVHDDPDIDYSQGATETGAPISYDDEIGNLESGLQTTAKDTAAQMDDAVRGLEPNPFASELGVSGDQALIGAPDGDTQTEDAVNPEIAAFDSGLGSTSAFATDTTDVDVPLDSPASYLQTEDHLRKH